MCKISSSIYKKLNDDIDECNYKLILTREIGKRMLKQKYETYRLLIHRFIIPSYINTDIIKYINIYNINTLNRTLTKSNIILLLTMINYIDLEWDKILHQT